MIDISRGLVEDIDRSSVDVRSFGKEIAFEVQQKKRMLVLLSLT